MRILEQVGWLNSHGHEAWVAARPESKIFSRRGMGAAAYCGAISRQCHPLVIRQLYAFIRQPWDRRRRLP